MKTPVFPHTVAFLLLGLLTPLAAQNLASTLDASEARFREEAAMVSGECEIPVIQRAKGESKTDQSVVTTRNTVTLDEKDATERKVDSVVDLAILRNPSPYRKVLVSAGSANDAAAESLQADLAKLSAVYREAGRSDQTSDCMSLALSVEQRVKLDPSKVLEIVETEVGANSACSCEIVKTAIKASEADVNGVVAIVEAAIHASPESMRIVSQCAIAASPESVNAVQALLTKLDPNAGETGYSSKSAKSSKDSKDSKVASIEAPPLPNPLDLPPEGPPLPPPPVIPPPVTDVDPCAYAH